MITQTSYQPDLFSSNFCHVINTKNDLQIDRIEYFFDKQKDLLVLLLENNLQLEREVNVFIQENNLILEATRGFSEIVLNQRYKYSILSSMVVNPRLLKVILSFQAIKNA